MFVDTAHVTLIAGRGGDGRMSFRHEKFIEKGGPDGGDGGRGGNVVFFADPNINTLINFRMKQELSAEPGEPGDKRQKHGRNGKDLIVKVPVGTVVKRDGEVVADLTENGQAVVIASGGDGGFGNAHFKSSTRQAPRIAEKGEMGDQFDAFLELKLLADVGLVGFPNAGKSTFLSVVSNARPEIANYEFTTLTPNLGVADIDSTSLLIADIPGLIEGASEGKGLGDAFLRHIERTAVILHLIDAYQNDPALAYTTIRGELSKYSEKIASLPEVIALTKIEGLDDDIVALQLDAIRAVAPTGTPLFAISSQSHKGLQEVLRALVEKVADVRQSELEMSEEVEEEIPLITLTDTEKDAGWSVESTKQGFLVRGAKIERFARRTNYEQFDSLDRLRDIMRKMGITHELRRQGVKSDSLITIEGSQAFTFYEQ